MVYETIALLLGAEIRQRTTKAILCVNANLQNRIMHVRDMALGTVRKYSVLPWPWSARCHPRP